MSVCSHKPFPFNFLLDHEIWANVCTTSCTSPDMADVNIYKIQTRSVFTKFYYVLEKSASFLLYGTTGQKLKSWAVPSKTIDFQDWFDAMKDFETEKVSMLKYI